MKRFTAYLVALLLIAAPMGGRAYSQAFQSLGSASLAVTDTTGSVALPATNFGNNIMVQNVGGIEAFIAFGSSTITATTAGESVPAGAARCFTMPSVTYLAAITASSTTTLRISKGNGPCSVSLRGGAPSGPAGGGLKGTYPNPSLADVNSIGTSLAIGGATIGTDALAWTGTATGSGALTAGSFIPTGSTVPTNGMYLSAANAVSFSTNSTTRWTITAFGSFLNAATASGAQLLISSAASTVPTFAPNRSDTTTGIGAQAAGNISLIAGASERARFTSTTSLINGVTTVAADTATPAGGSAAARLLLGTTAGFGIYYGSGAPSSLTAGKGSLYLRSDGTGVNDRMYINTDGSTTWTAVVTVG